MHFFTRLGMTQYHDFKPNRRPSLSRKSSSNGLTKLAGGVKKLMSKKFDLDDNSDGSDNEDEEEEVNMMTFMEAMTANIDQARVQTEFYMEHSFIGIVHFYFFMFLSVLSSLIFIMGTYLQNETGYVVRTMATAELCITTVFCADWSLSLFMAEQKIKYVFSFFSMVDLLTIVSVYSTSTVNSTPTCPEFTEIDDFESGLFYVLCGLGTTRILRALRIRKQIEFVEDEVQRFLYNMLLDITVMILFNSAVMQYLERHIVFFYFNDWMYYTVITITTVGYGDMSPSSHLGRIYCMAMVLFAIITVPKSTNELIEKIKNESIYHRASYRPKSKAMYHILICGDLKSSHIYEFFEELFHVDHDTKNLHAVILQPEYPNLDFINVMKDKVLGNHITYLEGNPLKNTDLQRAMASAARAIFIMTNNFSPRPDDVDAKTILQQLCIQKYLRLHGDGKVNAFFCMQLIRPENKRHLVTGGQDKDHEAVVVCLNEVKMGVIAKAACYPGTNTLLMNLCSSFSDEKQDELERERLIGELERESLGIETLDDDDDSDWIGEYSRGCDWEIYTTSLSSYFEGTTFCQLSEILYNKLGILLFGLEIEDIKGERTHDGKRESKILLNPADYVIPPKGEFKIQAYVIAKNKKESDLSFLQGTSSMLNNANIKNLAASHLALLSSGLAKAIPLISQRRKVHVTPQEEKEEQHNDKQPWQQLLRRHKTVSNESKQEELQRTEDAYLDENYFTRHSYLDVHDAVIKTSVNEELPFVDEHIIIIGKALSNLYDLIRPLRSKHLGKLKHIVIMCPVPVPQPVWQRICVFESVWIIRGAALEEADIRRAGVFKASQVIILADSADSDDFSTGNTKEDDAVKDADAIFCYQCVRRMNEKAQVIVEIVRHTNVAYLDPETGTTTNDVNYKFTPQFAAGALFATSLLDTLVCQAYFNPKIMNVLNKMIGCVDNRENFEYNKQRLNNLLKRPSNTASAARKKTLNDTIGSSLYQVSVNDVEGLETRTYGALFKALSKNKQIPLGLYRGVYSNTKTGPKANKLPYVFTNPPKDTELFTCDKVFILSQVPVVDKGKRGEVLEVHLYEGIRKNRNKTADDVHEMVGELRNEVRVFESDVRKMSEKLDNMAEVVANNQQAMLEGLETLRAKILGDDKKVSSGALGKSKVKPHDLYIPPFGGGRPGSGDRKSGGKRSFIQTPLGVKRGGVKPTVLMRGHTLSLMTPLSPTPTTSLSPNSLSSNLQTPQSSVMASGGAYTGGVGGGKSPTVTLPVSSQSRRGSNNSIKSSGSRGSGGSRGSRGTATPTPSTLGLLLGGNNRGARGGSRGERNSLRFSVAVEAPKERTRAISMG